MVDLRLGRLSLINRCVSFRTISWKQTAHSTIGYRFLAAVKFNTAMDVNNYNSSKAFILKLQKLRILSDSKC